MTLFAFHGNIGRTPSVWEKLAEVLSDLAFLARYAVGKAHV